MSLFERMKQGASEAARKVEQTVEITRLKSQISSREKEMDKLYARIGQSVYRSYIAGDVSTSEEEVMDYCAELTGLEQEIAEIQTKIKDIKLEKTCTGCETVVPVSVRYCPECGKKFPEEQQEKAPDTSAAEIRVICSRCGAENDMAARYCIGCGDELSAITADAKYAKKDDEDDGGHR
ncbi:zinc ribbon domain-containing protein [Paenibacillus sambharensis]|uniref:Zinc ribbon domain-containing protein n=1 Tax=Paenibacillus sambharensis TaxID=1803190 RepID=A0A2W1LLW2_9BACL|nr:zinc ribbon domain-containing protein [Paenibacillus sambharensis]PZD95504.1 zinc ribbon domain-containing protein [Paenibacillus sambharensis]